MSQSVLVTGGAGYIGSHICKRLLDAGYSVVVLDSLENGFRTSVAPEAIFYQGQTGDTVLVDRILKNHAIRSVIHMAAYVAVGESVENPLKYYENNVAESIALLKMCNKNGIQNFIFSSTAAVYGTPKILPITEQSPIAPESPYGDSKYMTEQVIRDLSKSSQLKHVILRYFNVAGASLDGSLGQSTANATHLIKVACEAGCGKRASVAIYGDDYPTRDGTGIRDYIHVDDLAEIHYLALKYLQNEGASQTLNCGYGQGFTVKEVLNMVQEVSQNHFDVTLAPRRSGDVAELVASNELLKKTLGWQPQYNDLRLICQTAYDWEKKR